jgi:hypothetical protein
MADQVRIEDLELAYQCSFSEDRRLVTVVVGSQLISPVKLEFGEDLPKDSRVMPEQFQVILEVPIHDDVAMLAMATVEIFSHSRKQHARFGRKIDLEEFLATLSRQIRRLIRMKASRRGQSKPVTRTPLEKLVDEIGTETMKGELGARGHAFVNAWLDKNLVSAGDSAEALFLAGILTLFKHEHVKRKHQAPQEDERPQD